MGLVATREVARQVIANMGTFGRSQKWAISGCSNSCSQPQLADHGIISRKLVTEEDSTRTPRFDLVQRNDLSRLGDTIQKNITLIEMQKIIDGLN
jgi:sulfite reductase beta subunit-like hemoprotein